MRFQLLEAHLFGAVRYRAGTIISDAGSAQPGDKIVELSASMITGAMAPLDAAAIALRNASAYASTPLRTTVSGVDSVDA